MTEEQFMLIFMGIVLLVCVIYAVLPQSVKERFHQCLERLVDKIDIFFEGLDKKRNQYTFNTVNNLLKLDEHDKELIKAYSDGFDIEKLTVKKVTEEVSFNDHYFSYCLPNDKTVYAEKRKQETQSYSFCIDVAGIPNTWQSQTIFVTKTESEDVSFSELPFFDRLAAKLF